MKKWIRTFAGSILIAVFSTLCYGSVYADNVFDDSGSIGKKALYAGVLTCYDDLQSPIKLSEFDGSYKGFFKFPGYDTYRTPAYVPRIGPVFNDDSYFNKNSCETVMTSKVAKPIPSDVTSNNSVKEKRLTDLSYVKVSNTEETSSDICYSFGLLYDKFSDDDVKVGEGTEYTQPLCIKKENGNSITYAGKDVGATTGIVSFSKLGKDTLKVTVDTGNLNFLGIGAKDYREISNIYATDEANILADVGDALIQMIGSTRPGNVIRNDTESTGEMGKDGFPIERNVEYKYRSACAKYNVIGNNNGIKCLTTDGTENTSFRADFNVNNVSDAEFEKNPQLQADGIINKFSNGLDKSKIKFSMDEKYALYQYYLTTYYGVGSVNCFAEQMFDSGVKTARLWWSEQNKYTRYCNFKVTAHENGSVWGVGDDDLFGVALTLDEMIDRLNKLTNVAAPESIIEGATDPDDPYTPAEPGDGDYCYSAADGLNGMAWVLCPTLYNLKGTAEGIGGLIDDLMEVDTVFYGSDSQAHDAWELMRNMANVLIVIVLLVIIFSQLTGYGIDNYGIKKILPRLVVMAILINLSFLLCQIAIDLSNIIGNGINNLLQAVANTEVTASQAIAGIVDALLAGVATIGANAGVITIAITAFSTGNGVAIVVLILALVAVVIGILIFFMMLGARTIIIVLFTVLSPLAIACYVLPNTQKYYKNWWKVFSTALMIFPICGATYGLSAIIRSIVFHNGEMHILMALVAMLTPILPYYIMPTLLKNMMSTLGSVGSIFNSLRSGLNKGISGASSMLRDTESYKNAAKESANKRLNNYNTRRFNRLKNKDERIAKRRGQVGAPLGSNLTKRQQVDLARASEAMKKYDSESQAAAAVLAEREFGSKSESEMNTAWEEAYVNGETARLTALTDVMTSKYGSGAISTMGKIMSKHRDVDPNGKIASSLKALSDNTVANKDFGKLFRAKATDAFRMATTREVGNDGKLKNLDYYSNDNKISTTFEDVLGQGAKAVERTALAGGFNAMLGENSATKILENESSNPALQAFLSDKDKRRAVEAVAYAEKQGTTIKDIMNAHEGDAAYSSDKILETLSKAYRDISGVKTATNGAAQPGAVFNVQGVGSALASDQYAAPQPRPTGASGEQASGAAAGGPDYNIDALNRAKEARRIARNKPNNGGGVM